MTEQEIIAKINEVLSDEFETDIDIITPDGALMQTLELDSLDLVDVVVLIESNFGVTLTGPDFVGVVTFQDFYDLINRKVNGVEEDKQEQGE
ncbi:MAG: phosphopantetheine-binding protein [Rikenellaceae bacterium]